MIKKTILKQVNKLLRDNNLKKSTTIIKTKKLIIYNIPCSRDDTGKIYFSVPTGVKIQWLKKQGIVGEIDFEKFFKNKREESKK